MSDTKVNSPEPVRHAPHDLLSEHLAGKKEPPPDAARVDLDQQKADLEREKANLERELQQLWPQ